MTIANVIEKICFPIKLFSVDTSSIGLVVSISICMIPVLRSEINDVMRSMNSKGKVVGVKSVMIIMRPILVSILRRTNEMEKCLILKGVEE